jgi:cytochrome c-type biogenesis protein CcmH/NrfG
MAMAALSWPAASIYIAVIIAVALVVSVLIWSIFRTGQTAIARDNHRRASNDKRQATARKV